MLNQNTQRETTGQAVDQNEARTMKLKELVHAGCESFTGGPACMIIGNTDHINLTF